MDPSSGKPGPVLYDFAAGRILWKPEVAGPDYEEPVWSPAGDEVAVVASGRLYLVNRDGKARSILDEKVESQVSPPVWSPDGRYLAFWNLSHLVLFDRQSDRVIDPCITNEYPEEPVWSPDSRQLVVGADLYEGFSHVRLWSIVMLDLIVNLQYPQAHRPGMGHGATSASQAETEARPSNLSGL